MSINSKQFSSNYNSIAFPYLTNKRITIFGGHTSWVNNIKPLLPDVRFINKNTIPNVDIIKNSDAVWVQVNAISHSYYSKIVNTAKNYNIPIKYFKYDSAKKCAEQVVKEYIQN